MDAKKLQALYGLKWDPFAQDLPIEGLRRTPKIEHFCSRVEDLVAHGGFSLITGDPGTGKSVSLRILADRLSRMRDVVLCEITRPQSRLSDFYRELATAFDIAVSPSNRWGGYKMLREKWQAHIKSTLMRPVLLIDEAQEVPPLVLDELRLLGSTQFDSCTIVTVVLSGDRRVLEKLKSPELLPIESRIKAKLTMESLSREELQDALRYAIDAAGNANLMTEELISTLADHAAGNLRLLMTLAQEVLAIGVARGARKLDEGLFLEIASPQPAPQPKPRAQPKGQHREMVHR